VDPPVPTHYAWEVLQGWVSGARIYERIGMPIWNVYDDALHRVVYKQHIDWYNQYGYLVPSNETSDTFEARGDDVWMLPIIDGAYGTNYSDYSKLSSHQESKIWDHGKNAGWSYVTFGDSSTGGGGSQTADFNPTDDSFVRGGSNADTNYDDDGTAQYLRVKNGNGEENDRESFLRFDIGGLTGTVSSATLKLYVDGLVNGTPAGASVYSVSVDSWDETTLTWNNKPGAITFQSKNASISSTGQYVNFDVTNFVSSEVAGGKSIISLALQDDDQLSKAVDFQRREDGNPPILSINYDGPPVNPQYDLSVSVNGSGSVSPSSGTYDDGTGVTLTATADVGWEFTGWSGDLSGSTNPAQVTMDADKNITATFTETNQTTNLTVSAVSASADDGNIPANTIDNDLGTRWSANGTGQWIKYDLASAYLVEYLEVAWFNGDQRQQYFNIEISADDVSWVQIWSGQSSGTSLALEQIDVADHTARYVRLVCNGNSSNAWNSMTELDIYGKTPPSSVELSPTSVTASADDGNVPTNTTDNDLVTRWSAQGDGQWIQYDYGQSHTFDKVSIAWHLGDVRQTTFDVEISSDASNWTQVFAGSSSGTTLAQEDISFSSTAGRYIRVVGHGNSSNDWNSMTEFDAYGYASAGRSRQSDPLTKSVEPVSALEVYPNPIENDLAIKYRAEQAGMVSIKIFSLEGQQVFNQQWHVGLGENLLELNVGGFNVHGQRSGWYAVHLTGFGQVETRKIIVK
ncbi:MAG: DNRLRE domain-containing protein, partial [Reichenbachiella sp.]